MELRDYYSILGVAKDATAEEIKRSYRKLALKYHPDRNAGDESAAVRYKEILQAYEVLSDPAKRAKYDELGHDNWCKTTQGVEAGYPTVSPGHGMFGGDDLFSELFRTPAARRRVDPSPAPA